MLKSRCPKEFRCVSRLTINLPVSSVSVKRRHAGLWGRNVNWFSMCVYIYLTSHTFFLDSGSWAGRAISNISCIDNKDMILDFGNHNMISCLCNYFESDYYRMAEVLHEGPNNISP